MKQLLLFLFACFVQVILIDSYDREMTVYVGPGRIECFYHTVKRDERLEIEYQVIDGGHGDLDISFTLFDNDNAILYTDYKKPEGVHRHQVQTDGDYSLCFDNSFSAFNRKIVFFELTVEDADEQSENVQWSNLTEDPSSQEYYEVKVMDILTYIGRIRSLLNKARQMQDMLRSNEARDRNLAEANFLKVNNWSMFQMCAMITVGLLQVFLVRSIFDTNTRMSKFWQMLRF